MTRRQKRRLMLVGLVMLGAGTATALSLTALKDNLLFFQSPSQVVGVGAPPAEVGERFRLGGLVAGGTVDRMDDGLTVRFIVTDTAHDVPVIFSGVLPDLFREGQGVVADGRLRPDGVFEAEDILARHDETYMPPEVAEALRAAGQGPLADAPPPAYGAGSLDP